LKLCWTTWVDHILLKFGWSKAFTIHSIYW
jgi:hypothetical protein